MSNYAKVEKVFADPPPSLTIQRSETLDGGHGRSETRRHAICHDVSWMFSDRRYPGKFTFPGLATIGMIERQTERGSETQVERHYYLCSTTLSADTLAGSSAVTRG